MREVEMSRKYVTAVCLIISILFIMVASCATPATQPLTERKDP